MWEAHQCNILERYPLKNDSCARIRPFGTNSIATLTGSDPTEARRTDQGDDRSHTARVEDGDDSASRGHLIGVPAVGLVEGIEFVQRRPTIDPHILDPTGEACLGEAVDTPAGELVISDMGSTGPNGGVCGARRERGTGCVVDARRGRLEDSCVRSPG